MKKLIFINFFSILIAISSYGHVDLLSPEGGETYTVGDVVLINWYEVVYHSTVTWDLYYSGDGGNTFNALTAPITYDANTATHNYLWTVPDTVGNDFQIFIEQIGTMNTYDSSSDNFTISPTISINSPADDSSLIIYPNPASDILQIKSNQAIESIRIYNTTGQSVIESKSSSTIDVRILLNGTYLVI
ncbi:MAG: T9SS type A sorting domain-containing protein [Flavobacteriales bacterium]|nr:T9SS type A sorting domain-containing protein [Flavobacteriales bacterium]